jgi:hypothetical protein
MLELNCDSLRLSYILVYLYPTCSSPSLPTVPILSHLVTSHPLLECFHTPNTIKHYEAVILGGALHYTLGTPVHTPDSAPIFIRVQYSGGGRA